MRATDDDDVVSERALIAATAHVCCWH